MMETISVIVPIYKVEPYLDRCVQSIVDQSYQNLEIILVDDGSPDNCPAMCDAWAEKDSRIKVIHKENGGLSDARNAGIAAATGELMGFVDSDDWIEPDMYFRLYQRMIDTQSDIVSGGVRRVWENGRASQQMTYQGTPLVLNRKEGMVSLMNETELVVPVWNKLYARKTVEDVFFPVGRINEDEFWSWRVLAKASRIAVIPEIFYNYLQRGDSIMSNQVLRHPLDAIDAKCQRDAYLAKCMPELVNINRMNLMYLCLYRAQVLKKTQAKSVSKVYIKQLKQIVQDYQPSQDYVHYMPMKQRLRYYMIQHFFTLTCDIQNLLHIGI